MTAAQQAAERPRVWRGRTPARRAQDLCLVTALVIYGLFSDPTPDQPGLAEALIGLLLVASVGPVHGLVVLTTSVLSRRRRPPLEVIGALALVFMLTVPLAAAIAHRADPVDLVRDIVPLIYQFIPVLLACRLLHSDWRWGTVIPLAVCFVGVAFSIRFILTSGLTVALVGVERFSDNMLYLHHDPAVLFAAIYLPLFGAGQVARGPLWRRVAGAAAMVLGVVPLGVIAAMTSRGALGAALLAYAVYCVWRLRRSAWFVVLPVAAVGGVLYLFGDQIPYVADAFVRKTQAVGVNAKDMEFSAVIHAVAASPWSVAFGKGWGALFFSPAATATVSYTHNLASYYLLKTGVVGLGVFSVYLVSLAWLGLRTARLDLLLFLAAGLTAANSMILQGSSRHLTMGVILLAVAVTALKGRAPRALPGRAAA